MPIKNFLTSVRTTVVNARDDLRKIARLLSDLRQEIGASRGELGGIRTELAEVRGQLETLRTLTKMQMLGPDRVMEFQYEGLPIKLSLPKPYSDGIQNFVFNSETFYEIKELVTVRKKYLRDGMTFIDVGAHIGNHSIFFAKCCAAAQVYSFEPNAASFEVLKRNFSLNGLSLNNLHNTGIGNDTKSGMRMSENEFGTHFGTAINISADQSAGGLLKIDKLDNFDFASCDFIKIDVEGWEIDVLLGAEHLLRKFRPLLWIEIEKDQFSDVENLLRSRGYACVERLLEHLSETWTVGNFIFKHAESR